MLTRSGGRVRDAKGRFAQTPGRQFGAGGGTAVIPVAQEPKLVTSSVPAIVAAIQRATARVNAFIALRITERLIETTPVDTGYARASWIATVGVRSGAVGGSPASVSEAAQQLGIIKLQTYKFGDGAIFITNNVPYIMRLNAGWSTKAPVGFIQYAVDGGFRDAQTQFNGASL